MRKAHFGTVDGAVAGAFQDCKHIMVARVEDDALDGRLFDPTHVREASPSSAFAMFARSGAPPGKERGGLWEERVQEGSWCVSVIFPYLQALQRRRHDFESAKCLGLSLSLSVARESCLFRCALGGWNKNKTSRVQHAEFVVGDASARRV